MCLTSKFLKDNFQNVSALQYFRPFLHLWVIFLRRIVSVTDEHETLLVWSFQTFHDFGLISFLDLYFYIETPLNMSVLRQKSYITH